MSTSTTSMSVASSTPPISSPVNDNEPVDESASAPEPAPVATDQDPALAQEGPEPEGEAANDNMPAENIPAIATEAV